VRTNYAPVDQRAVARILSPGNAGTTETGCGREMVIDPIRAWRVLTRARGAYHLNRRR